MDTAWLNGRFSPLSECRISVLDCGFLFGDGIYEVIPVYGGKCFRLPEHLQRLERSLTAINIANPLSAAQWQTLFNQLIDYNGGGNQSIYLQITRGIAERRDHRLPSPNEPTVFAMTSPLPVLPEHVKTGGVAAIIRDDIRWQRCDIKAITLLANTLLRQEAYAEDANEALLVKNGYITEGASSNVFAVIDGKIVTPPLANDILPGVTRQVILELAKANGFEHEEQALSETALCNATEVWISSSTRELYPVTSIEKNNIGNGKPGPIWQQVYNSLQQFKLAQAEL